jgi:Rrf2 family protein
MGECEGAWFLSKDIAERTGISRTYLSKILNRLTRSGLIAAKRGYRGGFKLLRPASKISLLEVIEVAEGCPWTPRCLLGPAECSDERSCPAHCVWSTAQTGIKSKLRRLTLADIAEFERRFAAADAGDGAAGLATARTITGEARPTVSERRKKHVRKSRRLPSRASNRSSLAAAEATQRPRSRIAQGSRALGPPLLRASRQACRSKMLIIVGASSGVSGAQSGREHTARGVPWATGPAAGRR